MLPHDPGSVSFSDSKTSPEVNSEVSQLENLSDDADDDLFHLIARHEWKSGILMMTLKWKMDEVTEVPFTLAKRDYPYEVSKYILDNCVGSANGNYSTGHFTQ